MTESNPLVSVIIAVYNCERYLAQAIKSVLAQTYRPIELIIVDDGSTDGTADIAHSYKEVHYIYQYNQGVAAARNTGISASQGQLISILDADDLFPPNKLKVQVTYLLKHPRVGYTVGRVQNFLDLESSLPTHTPTNLLESDQLGLASLVTRRVIFEQIGGFDASYRVASDFEWITRAKDAGIPIAILPEIVLHRRIHSSNMSYQTQARRASLLRMFKASIDRQRRQSLGQ